MVGQRTADIERDGKRFLHSDISLRDSLQRYSVRQLCPQLIRSTNQNGEYCGQRALQARQSGHIGLLAKQVAKTLLRLQGSLQPAPGDESSTRP